MKQQLSQLLFLGLLAAQALSVQYQLDVVTGSRKYDGTDGSFVAKVKGSKGEVAFGVLDDPSKNDFQLGATDNFAAESDIDIGKVKCVEIEAESDDAWMVDYITVTAGSEKTYVYNTEGSYLSSDTSEGKDKMSFCKQGDATYVLAITTKDENHAGTDNIHARLTISSARGKRGNTTTGILDNKGKDDFIRGATDTFTLPNLKNIGKAGCIFITAAQDDAWLFDEIKVTRGKSSRTFKNEDSTWLSSDDKEGKKELEICY